jgi:hypothetical protein
MSVPAFRATVLAMLIQKVEAPEGGGWSLGSLPGWFGAAALPISQSDGKLMWWVSDEDITSMDTTSHIRWSWSLTYFWTARKHLLATVVTASYGFQFWSSTTPWKDHQVYFETDLVSYGYLSRVGHNH